MLVFVGRQLIVIAIIFLGEEAYFGLSFSQKKTSFIENNNRKQIFLTEIVNSNKIAENNVKLNKDVKVRNFRQVNFDQTNYYDVVPNFPNIELKNSFSKKISINKCCPQHSYFDVDTFRCLEYKDDVYSFISFENFTDSSQAESKYKFIEKVPNCEEGYVLSVQIKSKVIISSDGIVLDKQLFSKYCIQENYPFSNETLVLTCTDAKNFCKKKNCFRKCCPLRESYRLNTTCQKFDDPFTPQIYDLNTLTLDNSVRLSDFGVIFGDGCGTKGKYILEKESNEESYFGLDGYLFVPTFKHKFGTNEFCLEYVTAENNSAEIGSFLCFNENFNSQSKNLLLTITFSISCFSLLLTFIVYLFLPKFQNRYGKSLICYIACLFTAYLCLAVAISTEILESHICTNIGYTILFSFLGAFFWLNVMSFDIWKTFCSNKSLDKTQLQKEKNKFLYYSIYAWIFPSIITALCIVVNQSENFPYPLLKPHLGEGENCWFSRGTSGKYFFFIAPSVLVITCNIIFFLRTALKIWTVKSEINKMERRKKKQFFANKDQFKIYCKLFIVMGITWSLEFISHLIPHPIWKVTDIINALHGVFIFAIFLFKREVIKEIQQKIRSQCKKNKLFTGKKTTAAGNDNKNSDETKSSDNKENSSPKNTC